ncbi:protein translocase subunit SecD [Altererythrobacter salegens]|uniref:Protein translocase subunit SecD n=1 Tax=Croceibacterium salegens TaxID=1737568 RepID=A0A6I4SVX8_9SPHN|nr:protein translocase subunit SecD [Croceibacterium salegens]MXO59499.1 protein translocase subunit SecD [Croceibacterium salegens]
MLDFPRWRRIWLWSLTILAALAAIPSLVVHTGGSWPSQLPDPQVNLGLDLAGGSRILLEAQPTQVAKQRLDAMEESVRTAMRRAEPRIRAGSYSSAGGNLSFIVNDPADVDRARDLIEPMTTGAGLTGQRDWTIEVVDQNKLVLTQSEAGLKQAVDQAMDTATEVVRRRIDALGTREPTIIREGDDRISVEVPGLDNPQALKDLLGKTANLEFKLVDTTALQSDIQQGIAPPGSEIVPYDPNSPYAGQAIAVKRLGGIRGDMLTNAQQSNDQQTNEPIVNITFDSQGARKFADLTSQNVNKPFAIILDGKALSAPNINEPILGGTAQISGGFTVETANNLAISLRSGALPVDLTVIQQGTVGPELGADSISKGLLAMGVGAGLVILLMIVTYGRFGVYATIALVFNVLMLVGIMSIMKTTLTLPGLAGFVLTIGAAVDANVLIYERIREERKRGRKAFTSVENGYKEASRAIYDANITNFIAGVLLFMFGSGPVKGFAIVLIVGLFTSVFTGVTLTRMWVAQWLRKARPTDLAI